jgi:hypothetical protein
VSNRTLVELNHDMGPLYGDKERLLAWATKMAAYVRTGDKRLLPPGVTFKHIRHHSEADPMEGRGDAS